MSDRDRAIAYYRRALALPDGMTKPTFYDVDCEGNQIPFGSPLRAGAYSTVHKGANPKNSGFSSKLTPKNTPETLESPPRENGQIESAQRPAGLFNVRDLTGKSFADLTPVRREGSGWSCRCRRAGCDRTIVVSREGLLSGAVVNCGEHCGVLA